MNSYFLNEHSSPNRMQLIRDPVLEFIINALVYVDPVCCYSIINHYS